MSQPLSGPSLDQYPGYFPAAKPPFWTRTKVGVCAGLVGLFFGFAAGAPGAADSDKPSADEQVSQTDLIPAADLEAQVDEAVTEATSRLEDELEGQRETAASQLQQARSKATIAQARAVKAAVAKVRSAERAKTAAAVARARANAQSQVQAPTLVGSSGGTDPQFSYCYEVVEAGYGPYYQGQDPEYAWYDDADNDGSVCE